MADALEQMAKRGALSLPAPAIRVSPSPRSVPTPVAPQKPMDRLAAMGQAIQQAESEFRQPATGFMSELQRVVALLSLGPRVIEAGLTRGQGYRKKFEQAGLPEQGSFGPAAVAAGVTAGVLDPLAPLTAVAGRLSGLARAAKPPVLRPVSRVFTEPVDIVGQRLATLPRESGGVVLPKPALPSIERVIPSAPTSVPKPLVQEVLQEPIHRKVAIAAEELFTKTGVQRDPSLLVSDQISDLLASGRIKVQDLDATLRAQGLSLTDFATNIFRPSVKDAARRLQALSAISRKINLLAKDAPEEAARLSQLASEADEMLAAKSLWKAPVNIWRAFLVSQPATAARNFITQAGRIGLDVIDAGVDDGIRRVTNQVRQARGLAPITHKTSPLEGLEALMNMFWKSRRAEAKKTADALLAAAPDQYDHAFSRFMSDVAVRSRTEGIALSPKDQIIVAGEKAASAVTIFNRTGEFIGRRAVIHATLDQQLRRIGKDLTDIIERNAMSEVPDEFIQKAVEKSLEMTFGRQPKFGTTGYHFVKWINGLGPIAAPAIPFPRFMVESLRFYYEFSPFGLLKLASPAERAAIASGSYRMISRVTVGFGLLGAAYAFRNSEFAGERWYQGETGGGRTIDLRPFNPFTPYLYVAELFRRGIHKEPINFRTRDLAQVAFGLRAGSGLYILDRVVEAFDDESKLPKALRMIETGIAEAASGFLTPLQAVYDTLAQFDERLRVVREERTEPLVGPFKSRIPYLAQTLPEVESPTRAGPLTREAPLLRQLTGITLGQKKNPIEAELDRLQFTPQEIAPSTGDPEADRLFKKHMGEVVEQILVPFVQTQQYKKLSDAAKGEYLRRYLAALRSVARARATSENPKLFQRLQFERRPERQRRLLEELGVTAPR